MSTKLHTEDGKEIVVVDHIYERGGISVSPVTTADLVAALIAEGGEIAEITFGGGGRWSSSYPTFEEPGRYLVFPLPAESAEAKETP